MSIKIVTGTKIWNNDKTLKEKWVNFEDLVDSIKSRIMWLEDTAPNGTPPYADLRIEELKNILAMLGIATSCSETVESEEKK